MIVGVLATDGGPHSAEKWAGATASQIIQIGADASGKQAAEARRLELQVLDILEKAHADLQAYERKRLTRDGTERLGFDIVPEKHMDDPVALILAAAAASPFAEHFAREEVQAYVRSVVGSHFATSIHIERSWKADANPDCDRAREFRAKHHG